jgi:hypothetical protein
MAQIMEMLMLICFGISWPVNILKSYRARTTRGKSILFLFFVLIGYYCGIAAKFFSGTINYVLVFYIINSIMVAIDIFLYFRNRKLDLISDPVEG